MYRVIPRRTIQQRNLARYMAYRAFAWQAMNDQAQWKVLSERSGIHKSDIAAIIKAGTSSKNKAMLLSAALGPEPLEAFIELADQWAEAMPAWVPGDPLPDPITHLSLVSGDRWAEMTQRYPSSLMRAGRALQLIEEDVSEAVIQDAIDLTWAANKSDPRTHAYIAREWLGEVESALRKIRRGSGERDSVKILSAPKR